MIGYVVLGTNDLVRATAFYDRLLPEMGVSRMKEKALNTDTGSAGAR
jgi:hypothetical protein